MTEKEKIKLKSLIRFHSANKIDNYNGGRWWEGKKIEKPKSEKRKKKNPKESTEQVKTQE